jgi:hypothetical protein
VPELKVGWFVAAQDAVRHRTPPRRLVSGGVSLGPLQLASNIALLASSAGHRIALNRQSTPAAAAKQFLFAAGAGLAISGARPFDR